MINGTVTETAGSGTGSCATSHAFTALGPHDVVVTVRDDDGGVGTATVRVVSYLPGEAWVISASSRRHDRRIVACWRRGEAEVGIRRVGELGFMPSAPTRHDIRSLVAPAIHAPEGIPEHDIPPAVHLPHQAARARSRSDAPIRWCCMTSSAAYQREQTFQRSCCVVSGRR